MPNYRLNHLSGQLNPLVFIFTLTRVRNPSIVKHERLQYYADLISGALKKKPLENDIICTRRVNVNPFRDYDIDDVVPIKQFFSASLFEEAAMSGDCEITLFVRKGTRGAFLDERVSNHPEQLEFLIDRDTAYRIMDIEGNHITVEVVP